MKLIHFFCHSVGYLLILFIFVLGRSQAAEPLEPLMLDLSKHCTGLLETAEGTNRAYMGFTGQQILDGLPFDVSRRGVLYGQKEAAWHNKKEADYPDFIGVKVGRSFEELHLLHGAHWAYVDGEAIALVRLNYEDDTKKELPIRYGVHVRDWQQLPSEEKDTLTDPDSKVIWRSLPKSSYSISTRLYKSRLINPKPKKEVVTIDFVSTKTLAAYDLLAATVAHRDDSRPVTDPVGTFIPQRDFNGTCEVLVIDADSDQPLANALVDPAMTVNQRGVIALPVRTDAKGKAVIRYPKERVSSHSARATLEGYTGDSFSGESDFPEQVTLRLQREK